MQPRCFLALYFMKNPKKNASQLLSARDVPITKEFQASRFRRHEQMQNKFALSLCKAIFISVEI